MERKAAPVIYLQNNGQVLTWGKENGWIPVKYHQISEKESAEESISRDIHYMLD